MKGLIIRGGEREIEIEIERARARARTRASERERERERERESAAYRERIFAIFFEASFFYKKFA